MTASEESAGPAGRQDNSAREGGIQNITHGGNVFNTTVYPPNAGRPARRSSGRTLALCIAGAAAVIAVPATVLALRYGPLKTENVDSARPAASDAPSSPSASPSGSAAPSATPSAASGTPVAGVAGQAAPSGSTGAATARAHLTPTPSSPYPSQNVTCAKRGLRTSVPGVEMQPCTQAVSGTGAAQFGAKVTNATNAQVVVTVLVKPYVAEVGNKECPSHPGPWPQIVIDPGQTWYSQFGQCSLGGLKGHRVQSMAWVALDSAGAAGLSSALSGNGRSVDIQADGSVVPAE
ncbi:hypothetical protein ABZ924_17135 [Streptomyces sp. NPDC046876]|uniref:hypothetical protein n=1 Tax=Streptomyces sp. NPDC046876 TaxID=3155616 RepID=UPI0033BFC28F